jgi:hypothetical protein
MIVDQFFWAGNGPKNSVSNRFVSQIQLTDSANIIYISTTKTGSFATRRRTRNKTGIAVQMRANAKEKSS